MASYEWFRARGAKHSVRRLKPKIEIVEPPERHQTVIMEPEPRYDIAEEISTLNNNQHAIHQRIYQIEGQQEFLMAASRKLLRDSARGSRKLDEIDHDLQYGSRVHVRPEPLYLREGSVSYVAPRRTENLLLDSGSDIHYRHCRSRSVGRADRAYIGDGVTYITSRHSRPTSWRPRSYAGSDSSSDSASTIFDYETPRRPRRTPVVHQRACECGGIGYHLTDCPRRARW